MQAVILAGGLGSRLEKLTEGLPKCLAEIGGRPLIEHQLEALSDQGVGPVLLVVGYKHEAIREVVGRRAEYILNERFRETNSLYSLRLAREWVTGPFVLLNSDLFFHPEILSRLLEEPGNVLAYDSTSSRGREQTKVAIRERRVVDLGKDLPPASARGESLGLLKFDAEGAKAMLAVVDELVRQGHEKAWVIDATRAVCKIVPIFGTNIASLDWIEVDYPYDLEQARHVVWPAIWKGRWRQLVYWRRIRWTVAALVALVLVVGGWFASARVGPGSLEWENVPPSTVAQQVVLRVRRGTQRWWLVPRYDSVAARIDGGGPVRVEFRLLMRPGSTDTARYVVNVSVDGKSHTWEALTATPDSQAVLDGAAVGDRDRLEFTLPPGQHVIQAALVAGQGDRLLVRVRRSE